MLPDFDFTVSVEPSAWRIAEFVARELVDEREEKTVDETVDETIEAPDGPWNQLKDALNACFGTWFAVKMNQTTVKRVVAKRTTVKRVYHCCPQWQDHYSWILSAPGRGPDFRRIHEIRPLVEMGLKDPYHATEALYRIDQRLKATGAF